MDKKNVQKMIAEKVLTDKKSCYDKFFLSSQIKSKKIFVIVFFFIFFFKTI
jgi:hypothetical protein